MGTVYWLGIWLSMNAFSLYLREIYLLSLLLSSHRGKFFAQLLLVVDNVQRWNAEIYIYQCTLVMLLPNTEPSVWLNIRMCERKEQRINGPVDESSAHALAPRASRAFIFATEMCHRKNKELQYGKCFWDSVVLEDRFPQVILLISNLWGQQ